MPCPNQARLPCSMWLMNKETFSLSTLKMCTSCMLRAMNWWDMVQERCFTEIKTDLSILIKQKWRTFWTENPLILGTKKVKPGMESSEILARHSKNAEQIFADSGFKVSQRCMKLLDLGKVIENWIFMFKLWTKSEKELLVFRFTTLSRRNGVKLIPKVLLFMLCIFTRIRRQIF